MTTWQAEAEVQGGMQVLRGSRTTDKESLTDKAITDHIVQYYGLAWKLDAHDPNRTVYLWNSEEKTWMGGKRAENDVLRLMGKIFAGEESRSRFSLEKVMLFIASQILSDKTKPPEDLPPHVVAFKNCLLPLKHLVVESALHYSTLFPAMEPIEKHPRWFWINEIPWDYDPGTECPEWLKWLGQVHHNEDLDFVQEWFGYNLYRGLPVPAFLINNGPSGAGKSVEIEALEDMVGEKNRCSVSPGELSKNPYAPAQLHNKLACISDEVGGGTVYYDGMLKAVTSGETITARHIYGAPFDMKPYAKMTLSVNDPPDIKTSSPDAIERRLYFIDWPHVFKQDPDSSKGELQAKPDGYFHPRFLIEMPGIVKWACEGLRRLMANNWRFTEGRSRFEMFALYKRRANQTRCFIEECVEITGNEDDVVMTSALAKLFTDWQSMRNIKNRISRDKFFKELKDMGFETERPREYDRRRVYTGLRLKTVPMSLPPIQHLPTIDSNIVDEVERVIENARDSGTDTLYPLDTQDIYHYEPKKTPATTTDPLSGQICLNCLSWQGSSNTQMAYCCLTRKSTAQEHTCQSWQPKMMGGDF